jgi:hypothetical protein
MRNPDGDVDGNTVLNTDLNSHIDAGMYAWVRSDDIDRPDDRSGNNGHG